MRNSIVMAIGMDINGWSNIPNDQMINGKVAVVNAIMYDDARNDNNGMIQNPIDFHNSPSKNPGI